MIFTELKNIYGIISRHPIAGKQKTKSIFRFLKWQIARRLMPYPFVYPFVGEMKLILQQGLTSATAQYYMGLSEFEEMSFVLHFIEKEDLFVDVGANVGCFTLLASGVKKANTIAIEPLPSTFQHLCNNLIINKLEENVEVLNIGVGAKEGSLEFTHDNSQNNHVATKNDCNTVSVQIKTLDNVLKDRNPTMLKIDVEGFERAVIDGSSETLKKESLRVVLIELVGLGARYGYDELEIQEILMSHGFKKYDYNPYKRELTETRNLGYHNTFYIRDVNFIQKRLMEAAEFTILQQKF